MMKFKGLLVKQGERLIPANDEDSKEIFKLSDGEFITFTLNDSRNIQFHRKYWKLLSEVHNHMNELLAEKYPTPESIHTAIKFVLKMYKVIEMPDGKRIPEFEKTDFMTMGQRKYEDYVNRAKNVILEYFLPDISEDIFQKEFMTLIF